MGKLMRCLFCGLLQDEPIGVKTCPRCGGELVFEDERIHDGLSNSYLNVQMELDQIYAPAGRVVDRYILLTISTPTEVPGKYQLEGSRKRPPVNFNPVIDRSGSMRGKKIDHVRKAVLKAADYLKEGDAFSLVVFSDPAEIIFRSKNFNEDILHKIKTEVPKIVPGGMTALHAGLTFGLEQAQRLMKESNLVLLLSDGLANVGITDLEEIGQTAKHAREVGITVSTIGVGFDYNEALLAEIATQGGGRFYHIEDPAQIPNFIAGELNETANWAAKELKVSLELPQGAAGMGISSAYPVLINGTKLVISIGDVPCDAQIEIPVRISFPPTENGERYQLNGDFIFQSPAGIKLGEMLNPVTLRFVDQKTFLPNNGVVEDVLYRVFQQRRAASMINVQRAMYSRSMNALKEQEKAVHELRDYVSRLGKERARTETVEFERDFSVLEDLNFASKNVIMNSYRRSRGQKDFRKDRS